jgi:neopullulanase
VLGYEAWWDLPPLPKLNLHEPHMRAHILEVAEHWIRFGIDGWRLDVPEEVDEGFWREFHARVRSVDPDAYLVGEVWRPKPEWLTGGVFDAFMNYPLLEAIVGFAAGQHLDRSSFHNRTLEEDLHALDGPGFAARVMELDALYDPAVRAIQLNLLGSHDTPRVRTMCGGDLDSVRLAMLAQMTLPGAPCVYYGDEIGLEGGQDPLCRAGFPTDPAAWRGEPHGWLADLVAARHSSRALRDGALTMLRAEGMAVAWLREHGPDAFVAIMNAGDEPLAWTIELPRACDGAEVLRLGGTHPPDPRASVAAEDGTISRLQLAVGARQGAVVRLGRPGRP